MNEIYINPETGELFEVSADKKDQFLIDFPNAVLQTEEEKPEEITTEMFVNPDNGEQFEVSIDKKNLFLQDFPNAVPIDQAGKQTPSAQDAVAGENKASDTDLQSEDGSLESRQNDISAFESIKNAFINVGKDIKGIYEFWTGEDPALDIATASIYNGLFGAEKMDDFVERNKGKWLVEGIGTQEILEKIPELEKDRQERKPTLEIIESLKKGQIVDAGAGIASAFVNTIGSALYGVATMGAGFFMDFAADNYLEYNKALAKRKNKKLEDLIKEDEAEIMVPVGVAYAQALAENIGLGKMLKPVGKAASKTIFKKAIEGYGKGKSATLLEAGGTEAITEMFQYGAEEFNRKLGETGKESEAAGAFFDGVFSQQGFESGLQGLVGGIGVSGSRMLANNNARTPTDVDAIDNDLKNLSNLNKEYNRARSETVKEGVQERINEVKNNISERVKRTNLQVENMTEEQIEKINELGKLAEVQLSKVDKLNEEFDDGKIDRKQYTSALNGFNKAYIDTKNKIHEVLLEENIEVATKLSKDLGFEKDPNVYNTTLEYNIALAKKLGITLKEAKDVSKNTDGVFIGEGEILIDKQRAIEIGAVSVGSHEILHPILNAVIGDKKSQGKIVNEFKKVMTSKQRTYVEQQLRDNVDQSKWDTEYLNYFSDGILKGKIDYDKTLFERIGDIIIRIFKGKGFNNISFDNGRDVYNFLKEYNTSIKETGKVSSKAVEAIKAGEVKTGRKAATVGLAGSIQKSTTEDLNKKVDNLVGQKDEAGNYKYKSKEEFQSSEEFVNAYDKIINGKLLDGLILKGIEGRDVYGVSLEDFIEQVKTGQGSLTDLLLKFDPTKNNSLIGYINSQLSYKKGDLLKKLKKQQTKSIDTAAGEVGSIAELEADDTSEALLEESMAEEQRQSGLIKAEEILSKDFVKAATEEVVGKLAQITPKDLTFKNVKGLVVDTLAKEIGIPAKKIMDTTANMSSQEMGVSINWIKQHANQIAKIMPQGAVLDSASEKLLGTATGIANSILKNPKLYTKNPRIKKGPGLSPFVKNKNIKGEDVLNAIGIVNGEPKPGIGPRTPEGQAVKGILAMYEKLVSNSLLRQELIDQGESLNVIQDIGAGKGDLMFSMSSEDIKLLNQYDINGYKLESKADINKYISDLRKLIPLLNTNDFKILNATVLQFSNLDTKELVKYLQSELKKLSKSKELTRFVTISRTAVRKKFGSTFEDLKEKIKIPGYVQEYNEQNSLVFEKMWNTINEILSDPKNKDLAPVIVTFLANSQIEKANPHRLGAPLVAYELANGRIDSYEHAMPSVEAYRRLIKASLDPNIDFAEEFEFVKNNYKLMAITKETDDKLLANGSNSFFDTKWKHWWQRYFNPKVAALKGGIDPSKIYSIYAEESLAEEYNITNKGAKEGQFSKNLNREFNDILQATTGVDSKKTYSKIGAEMAGSKKGRFDFFIPPGAEDFIGLIYKTLGKGEIGDRQLAWYKKNFFDPYARAMAAVTKDRVVMAQKFKDLRKELKIVPKNLRKKLPGEGFTQEQAVRVYIWTKQGEKIPGLNEGDLSTLNDYVKNNPELKEFGDRLIAIAGKDAYVAPREGWTAGTITTDLLDTVNGSKRAMHLEQWQDNVNAVFTEENLNKLEALYGKSYRVALENILKRMKSGRNRLFTSDSLTGRFVDWISNSIGSIMFFNSRSAILQTISSINFINFTDNNIIAAGKALANPKQFASDFMTLMNSEFLVDRRNGLRINVNEADIANIAATSKNKAKAFISEMLKLGFLPTQIADSFAIASGGAAFYRNRINTYLKQGLNQTTAEQNAMRDFRETAEESQQSSRPDKISQQQAGPLGRIILAFANTPAQYARIIKKAALDLKNGRGDRKTNISKIVYYGVAQNLLFSAMQNALFALMFDGDEDEEKAEEENKKYGRVANNMADSLLRGMGFVGAVTSVVKNAALKIVEESNKDIPKYEKAAKELIKISPPISSKLSKVESALRSASWDRDKIKEAGLSIDNPAYMIGGKLSSAAFNIPLDRALTKVDNIQNAMSKETEIWQKFALLAGWQSWELGIEDEDDKTKRGSTKRKTSERKTVKRKTVKRNK